MHFKYGSFVFAKWTNSKKFIELIIFLKVSHFFFIQMKQKIATVV